MFRTNNILVNLGRKTVKCHSRHIILSDRFHSRTRPPIKSPIRPHRLIINHVKHLSCISSCNMQQYLVDKVDRIKKPITYNEKSSDCVDHNTVEIMIHDNDIMLFNTVWLRHSCRCDKCTHEHSRQRLYDVTKLSRDNFTIKSIEHIADGSFNNLDITWGDEHSSRFDVNWLQTISMLTKDCDDTFGPNKPIAVNRRTLPEGKLPNDDFYKPIFECPKQIWGVDEITKSLQPVDFNLLLEEGDANLNFRSLVAQLTEFGIVKLVNVPQKKGQILKVVRRVAYERPTGYGLTFDVVVEASDKINLAYSSQEFDLHVDLPYRESTPGVQLLHCIKNSQEGGENYFCDGFKVASALRDTDPKAYEVLSRVPVTFSSIDPYRNVKFRRECPIINESRGEIESVYYSPWMLPPLTSTSQIGLFYDAYRKFSNLMHDNRNKFITKMRPGDLYMFHNRRVFHGRNQYDSRPGNRMLEGCYMDWDEVLGAYERLFKR